MHTSELKLYHLQSDVYCRGILECSLCRSSEKPVPIEKFALVGKVDQEVLGDMSKYPSQAHLLSTLVYEDASDTAITHGAWPSI